MTKYMAPKKLQNIKLSSVKACGLTALALSLAACSSVPQENSIRTDLTGSLSHMWSNIFTGELRPAPQSHYSFGPQNMPSPQYVFGANDAALNTPLLVNRLSLQAATKPAAHYMPPVSINTYMRPDEISPWERRRASQNLIETPSPVVQPKQFNNSLEVYESPRAFQSASAAPRAAFGTPPPMSQPVVGNPAVPREAYPRQEASYQFEKEQSFQAAASSGADSLSYVKIGGGSQISDWEACEKRAGGYFNPTASGFTVNPSFDACMRSSGYMPEEEAELELAGKPR